MWGSVGDGSWGQVEAAAGEVTAQVKATERTAEPGTHPLTCPSPDPTGSCIPRSAVPRCILALPGPRLRLHNFAVPPSPCCAPFTLPCPQSLRGAA